MVMRCFAAVSAAVLLVSVPVQAGEALFGYVYTTELTPKGHVEVEQWVTDKIGQENGHFNELKLRSEVEFGVTDNFQIAGYLNTNYFSDAAEPGNGGLKYDGFAVEAIWRLLSPYKDGFGLALYVEPEIAHDEIELEGKILLQKNFLGDRLVVAGNLIAAVIREDGAVTRDPVTGFVTGISPDEKISELGLDLGASYRVATGLSIGAEYRYQIEYGNNAFSNKQHSAHFAGPTVHYAKDKWFVTLTYLREFGARDYAVSAPGPFDPVTTKGGLRLKLGVGF